METSMLAGAREFPPARRLLIAGAAVAGSGVVAVVLLAHALTAALDGDVAAAITSAVVAPVVTAVAAAVWFRMLPSARWLGLPVALGLVALLWDLLTPFVLA